VPFLNCPFFLRPCCSPAVFAGFFMVQTYAPLGALSRIAYILNFLGSATTPEMCLVGLGSSFVGCAVNFNSISPF
jgi:hypothetical protein